MIINLDVWINDSMSSSEKRIAIQKVVTAVDTAIINDEESCIFDVVFERRLPASTLFNKTPYNKYDQIDNIRVFDSVLEKQFSEISNYITIKRIFNRANTPISLQQGHRLKLSLIAKPSISYRENRLSQYSDRSFTKKLLSEHGSILEKIYTSIIGYSGPVLVCSRGVGIYSDCWIGGIEFSELGMVNLDDSFQIYQMTLALIEFLSSKGFVCSIPKAHCNARKIEFDFRFFREVNESQSQLKSW